MDEARIFKVYDLDLEKLQKALDAKIKQNRITRARVAQRIGLSESTLCFLTKNSRQKGLHSRALVNILMYLKRPLTDFVVEVKNEN